MRNRGRRWVVAAVGCGLVAACTTTPTRTTQEQVWAPGAQQYFAAFHAAQGVGYTNLAPFYAPDAHVDYALMTYDGYGRPRAIQALRDIAQPVPVTVGGRDPTDAGQVSNDEPLYVSVDGAVDVSRITSADYTIPFASVYRLGPAGIESEVWTGSVKAGEQYEVLDRAPLEKIGRAYVGAWSSGDPDAVAELYATTAQVDDSLAGLSVQGRTSIGSAAARTWAEGGLRGTTLHEVPQEGGPAIYVNAESTGSGPIDRMVLLLHLDAGDGCPGDVAVALHLDGSSILSEERYHRVDSPVACWEGPPSRWWDDVRIPNPRAIARTGTMTVHGIDVAIWNGTPDPSPLIAWGLQRFADAGLPAPIPTSVTFLPRGENPWLDHGFEEGTTAPDLAIPLPASDACWDEGCTRWPPEAKAAVLHQLAHLYLADPSYPRWEDPLVGPNRMAPYRTAHDLTWLDPKRPWQEQASQLAAETVAWGLMDEPYIVDARMGVASCSQLARDFALLTASTPDPRACTAGAGDADEPVLDPVSPRESTAPQPAATSPTGPAASAERWFDAYDAAVDRGLLDLHGFYATDVTVDHRALGMDITSGRDALRDHMTTMAGAILLQREPIGSLHVSRTGAVTVMALPGSTKAAFVLALAPTGITSETYAPSLVTLRSAHPSDDRLASLQRFADDYVRSWADGDRSAVADLYSPDARIADELLGIDATGARTVGDLAQSDLAGGGLLDASSVSLADLGGPAIFATGDYDADDPLDTVVLLLRTGDACPGHLAIVLRLDAEGRISEETRHHSSSDLGGCAAPGDLAGAWWEGLAIPPGISVVQSGTLTLQDRTISVRNSSPALNRLLAWGLQRYSAAELDVPAVRAVTFVDRKAPACSGINGLAAGSEVSLCFGTADACSDDGCTGWRAWAKATLLHELAHVWISENVAQDVRDQFLSVSGLPTWESVDSLWGDRGVELAAEAMAGSLMDEPVTLNIEFDRRYSCAELARLYAILAGAPPVDPPCEDLGEPPPS